MSNKRRRIQGLLPINTIDSHADYKEHDHSNEGDRSMFSKMEIRVPGSPRRYREFRRDPRVVDELNHSTSRDFLPLGNDEELDDQDREEDQKNWMISSNSPEEDRRLENFRQVTPSKHNNKKANGLLFPSPGEDNVTATAFKLQTPGILRTVDIRKQMDEKNQCLMVFHDDSQHPKVNFIHKNVEIKNSQLELVRDCDQLIFDRDSTCMAMVLKELRFIDMGIKSKAGRIQTKLLLWMGNKEGKDNAIAKIKNVLIGIKDIQIKTLEGRAAVVKKLSEIAIQDCKRSVFTISSDDAVERLKSKRNFLDKKNFSSLGPQKRLSQYATSAGHKIHVPKMSVVHDLDDPTLPDISTKDFYSVNSDHTTMNGDTTNNNANNNTNNDINNNADNTTEVSFHDKADSPEGLRKSSRNRSQGTSLRQSTLWDLDSEKDFEIPKVFKPKLRYKFEDGSNYTITNQDFRCLYNHDWINDSILDFFTKYYVESSIEKGIVKRNEVHIMSSFFYTKLVSNPADYYGNVKKWVNNCDLLKKKYVVVPINNSYHWFGCIITNLNVLYNHYKGFNMDNHPLQANDDMKQKTISNDVDDDEISISTPIVTILTFDSLRQTHTREIDPIKEFLIAYAKDRYAMEIDKSLIKMKTCMVPQQPNMSDCGVHVILNTKKFFEDPKAATHIWRMTKIRNKQSTKAINEFFDKASRSSAREHLRNVLWDLQKKQMELMKMRNENHLEEDSAMKDDGDDGDIEIIEHPLQNQAKKESGNPTEDRALVMPPDDRSRLQSVADRSFKNSPTATGNAEEKNSLSVNVDDKKNSNNESEEVDYSKNSSPRRHVLESSPIGERLDENRSSPYFGDSPLKKRAPSFGSRPHETSFSLRQSSFVDTNEPDQKGRYKTSSNSPENSASPVTLTDEILHDKKDPIVSYHGGDKDCSPSSSSEKNMTFDLDQDSDVNLVGRISSKPIERDDHLGHLQQEFEKELNDRVGDGRIFLNRPNTRRLRPVLVNSMTEGLGISDYGADSTRTRPLNANIISQNDDIHTISSEEEK